MSLMLLFCIGQEYNDALRTNPVELDDNGLILWNLKSYNEEPTILLQGVKDRLEFSICCGKEYVTDFNLFCIWVQIWEAVVTYVLMKNGILLAPSRNHRLRSTSLSKGK